MKITLFTSNNIRHNYLLNLLSKICDELFVVQEHNVLFSEITPGYDSTSSIIKKYFKEVNNAQKKFFGDANVNKLEKKIKILPIKTGELNQCSMDLLKNFLKSDYYIVFGSSYIKGELVNFLVDSKAINIHMGVSPYYRGSDCNFWALLDENPHLVGATIHLLSKGLDSGPMLYHAMSNFKTNSFEYTMSAVKSAFHSIVERIKDKSILNIEPEFQNKAKEIRYSKAIEFNEKVVENFFSKKINLNSKKFDNKLLKNPFFLNI